MTSKREKEIEKCVYEILEMHDMFQDMRASIVNPYNYDPTKCVKALAAVVTLRRLALGDPL